MKTMLSLVVLAAVGGVVGYHYWQTGATTQPKFRTLPIARGDLLNAVNATGTVEPVEINEVGAQIIGRIVSFGPDPDRPGKTIDYRSRVRTGQLLATLDDLPYKSELEEARANVKLAEAELDRYRLKREQLARDLKRAEKLRVTNSEAENEHARSEFEISKADLGMSEARLALANTALTLAENNLSYTKILSPVDGVVIDRKVNIGQTIVVGLNAPCLFLLAKDLDHMLVWTAVNEADISKITVGQKVNFKVDAYRDRSYTGKVSQIRLNASVLQNVVTFPVVVDVDNTDGTLMPYMTAKLQFEVSSCEDALLVPNQAINWRPTWAQILPSARSGLKPPAAGKTPAAEKKEKKDTEEGQEDESEPRVEVGSPTLWVLADDGLVRPVAVQVGLSDGMRTAIMGGEVDVGTAVVVNAIKQAAPDFVSSFISRVTNKKK